MLCYRFTCQPCASIIETEWRIYSSVNLPQLNHIIACRLVGAKPFSEPMLLIWNVKPFSEPMLLIWNVPSEQNKFQWTLIRIQALSFKKMHLKILSAKWRPFCLGLNVFRMGMPMIMMLTILMTIAKYSEPKMIIRFAIFIKIYLINLLRPSISGN